MFLVMNTKWVNTFGKMLAWLLAGSVLLLTLPGPAVAGVAADPVISAEKKLTCGDMNLKFETIAKAKGIPSVLLKMVAYQESGWRQWDAAGNPLLSQSEYPAIGIMQISSKYIQDEKVIQKLKEDIDFNIATGADILNDKWNIVPRIGDGDRNKLENWYFVLWAYNQWTEGNNPRFLADGVAGSKGSDGNMGITTETAEVAGKTSTTGGTPGIPYIAYQDKILALCANPPKLLASYVKPVSITKIDLKLLPATGVPAANGNWDTPLPYHYGNLTDPPVLTRISGSDRIDTANRQAIAGWPEGAPAVVLARADAFPDALAGVPLAAQVNAPILLTGSQTLDDRVAKTIAKLNPDKIYLLGGEGAISAKISKSLVDLGWDGARQERISGTDRYATAAAIAAETVKEIADSAASETTCPAAVLATGENFPDALSIAAVAGADHMPVLLTTKNSLPQATAEVLKKIQPEKVYIIGGNGVIAPSVTAGTQALLGIPQDQVIRLAGSDRYGTAVAVLKHFAPEPGSLAFATGENFPDALAGAALAAKTGAKLVLLPPGKLEGYTDLRDYLSGSWMGLSAATIYGGEGAVSAARQKELEGFGGQS